MAPTAAAPADVAPPADPRESEEDASGLMSFGSPRGSLSLSLSAAEQQKDRRGAADGGRDESAELLAYYRRRCDEFQGERQRMLDRLAEIEVSREETHRLKWELKSKASELAELQEALAQTNAALFESKRQRIDLEAENSALRLRERQDRDKIRQLLALTQPITEQVTFVRDCRPGARAAFPVHSTPPTPRTFEYPSTMHIASERMRSAPARRNRSSSSYSLSPVEQFGVEHVGNVEYNQQHNARAATDARRAANATATATAASAAASPYRVVPAAKVLRTVYMPNEQSGELNATVESLRKQLDAREQLSDEKTRHLVEQFAEEKAALLRRQRELEEKLELMDKQAGKTQRVLMQTTKDYLVLRHRAQEQERLAREEVHSMATQCEAFKQERDEVSQQVERERELVQEAAREEGNQTALTFRSQALSRERDLHILKEQYAAVQEACTKRIQDLQARLTKLRGRYRSLDRRRAMEMEGFSRDIAGLKRHLQKLEVMHYGRRLTAQEREALRLDENYTLNSNELSEEIAALQHRIAELSADLAEV